LIVVEHKNIFKAGFPESLMKRGVFFLVLLAVFIVLIGFVIFNSNKQNGVSLSPDNVNCNADLNGDGFIDVNDSALLQDAVDYGCDHCSGYDLNYDLVIDQSDIDILQQNMGVNCSYDYSSYNSGDYCSSLYEPVCGVDGITYDNSCVADSYGVEINYTGECVVEAIQPEVPLQYFDDMYFKICEDADCESTKTLFLANERIYIKGYNTQGAVLTIDLTKPDGSVETISFDGDLATINSGQNGIYQLTINADKEGFYSESFDGEFKVVGALANVLDMRGKLVSGCPNGICSIGGDFDSLLASVQMWQSNSIDTEALLRLIGSYLI